MKTGMGVRGRIIGVLALLLVAACGDTTEPVIDISGEWVYSITQLSGSGATCSAATTLNISQNNETFSGTYSGGLMQCYVDGRYVAGGSLGGVIVNGRVNGDDILFNLADTNWMNEGTIQGSQITGRATLSVSGLSLSGIFYAVRR